MHAGDSPVEGYARDSATKKEGNAIAMDTMRQEFDLGEGDGVGVFEGMRTEWRAFCVQ